MMQYKSHVPRSVREKIQSVIDVVEKNFTKLFQVQEITGDIATHEIEGNYKSGWIPNQDGGINLNAFLVSDTGYTEKHKDDMQEQEQNCFSAFLSDKKLDSELTYDDLTDEQRDELSEYELEWKHDSLPLLAFMIYVGNNGSVTLDSSINYRDAPYYREKYAETLKTVFFEQEEFLQADMFTLLNPIFGKIAE